MSHFRAALLANNLGSAGAVNEMWLNYALTTNTRGEELLEKLTREFCGDLHGKRFLDIGAGYGGACIAAARRGAEVIGIEISERNVALAGENMRDHPGLEIKLLSRDILDLGVQRRLGEFDAIVCDNVIEHVDSARRLIRNISALMKPQATAYITTPNAFSFGQVMSECHYQLFGISILDRFDAQARFNEVGWRGNYDVGDYFSYDQYLGMFRENGLSMAQLVPPADDLAALENLAAMASDVSEKAKLVAQETSPTGRKLAAMLKLYLSRFRDRHEEALAERGPRQNTLIRELSRDYGLQLWYFVVRPQ